MTKVLIWNEFIHEKQSGRAAENYPEGIHVCIGEALKKYGDISVRYATLDMEKQGLSEEILADTDALIWWGHRAHNEVTDENAEAVARHVNGGMGFIPLHSAHHSKPMKLLCGTSCNLRWRHGDRERIWCTNPAHPIARGVEQGFLLPEEEMYGEPFDIPDPLETVFLGWFSGGDVFRSGVTFRRGMGRIFYFQPGHEEYPVYRDENIMKIIRNAVLWSSACGREHKGIVCEKSEPLENAE